MSQPCGRQSRRMAALMEQQKASLAWLSRRCISVVTDSCYTCYKPRPSDMKKAGNAGLFLTLQLQGR